MRETLREVVSTLDNLDDKWPLLDKDELESRLSDLESDARAILDDGAEYVRDMQRRVEELADAIHALYNEV